MDIRCVCILRCVYVCFCWFFQLCLKKQNVFMRLCLWFLCLSKKRRLISFDDVSVLRMMMMGESVCLLLVRFGSFPSSEHASITHHHRCEEPLWRIHNTSKRRGGCPSDDCMQKCRTFWSSNQKFPFNGGKREDGQTIWWADDFRLGSLLLERELPWTNWYPRHDKFEFEQCFEIVMPRWLTDDGRHTDASVRPKCVLFWWGPP